MPMHDFMTYEKAGKQLSLKEKVGQCFMPAAFINDSEEEIQKLEQQIEEFNIGSICFFHSRASAATNFEGKKEVLKNEQSYERLLQLIARYQKAAKHPLLIAIDAEWGLAMRIENTPQYPYALTLGAMQGRTDLVFEVGRQIATDCKKAGIHWNLAPCVDINLNPENPVIGYRSFGTDRRQVTRYAKAYLDGMSEVGILNSIKHFPGHGDTAVDSHLGLPKIEKSRKSLFANELYPFVELMKSGVDSVMVGHLAVPALSGGSIVSASISKAMITNFLRTELGYEGVVISDALNMHGVSKQFSKPGDVEHTAFEAGNDVLCFADNVEPGIKKIAQSVEQERIEKSFERIWKLKQKAFSKTTADKRSTRQENLIHNLAEASMTILKNEPQIFDRVRNEGAVLRIVGNPLQKFSNQFSANIKEGPFKVLAIHPRQVKPKDNFGFTDTELQTMNETLKGRRALLYLFGNPFVLDTLDWERAAAVVIVYQDFEPFQEVAANHLLGKITVKGKLPVLLKTSLYE